MVSPLLCFIGDTLIWLRWWQSKPRPTRQTVNGNSHDILNRSGCRCDCDLLIAYGFDVVTEPEPLAPMQNNQSGGIPVTDHRN